MKVPYPIIGTREGDDSPIRLFDSDIVDYLRENSGNESRIRYISEARDRKRAELKEISVPGFRYPNPSLGEDYVKTSIRCLRREILNLGNELAEAEKNPIQGWDTYSFAEKVSAQIWLVGMVAPPNAEIEREFEAYVREITAEAEIIELWNSL